MELRINRVRINRSRPVNDMYCTLSWIGNFLAGAPVDVLGWVGLGRLFLLCKRRAVTYMYKSERTSGWQSCHTIHSDLRVNGGLVFDWVHQFSPGPLLFWVSWRMLLVLAASNSWDPCHTSRSRSKGVTMLCLPSAWDVIGRTYWQLYVVVEK